MSNKTYDVLKWAVQVFLPAFSVFIYAVGGQWGLPHLDDITVTIAAATAFGGALLGIESAKYHAKNS